MKAERSLDTCRVVKRCPARTAAPPPACSDHLLSNLHKCITLNGLYQEEYGKARETLAQMEGGKQFDFNELHIFGKFELFCKRIQKLIDVFTTIEQFMSLSQYNIDGMEGLIQRFFEIVDDLKRKTGDLLDYTKPTFDKDYIEFNKNIQVIRCPRHPLR